MIDVDYNEYKETIAENMKLIVENNRLKEVEKEHKKLNGELREEIERLNNALKEYDRGTYCKLINENRKLNNIINELEKELKEDYKIWMCNSRSNGKSVKFGIDVCKTHFYNRLQELKASDKK